MLEEAYSSISETDHSTLRAAQTDEENAEDDRKAAGLKKQGEIMKKDLKDEEKVNENSLDEIDDMMPDEAPAMEREPDEVDSEIESLKNLILNPPADKIEEYAQQGQLHVYVDMLKKKLEAAEAVKAAVRGESE